MMPEEKELIALIVVILLKFQYHSLITGSESVACDVPLPHQPETMPGVAETIATLLLANSAHANTEGPGYYFASPVCLEYNRAVTEWGEIINMVSFIKKHSRKLLSSKFQDR